MYKAGWTALMLSLLAVTAAVAQPAPVWIEIEEPELRFGTLDPDAEVPPLPLLVRVHSSVEWELRLLPSPGRELESGALLPPERLVWRPGSTGRFLPLDATGPVVLAGGGPTGDAGTLVLTELALTLDDYDPTGDYTFDLRLRAVPAEQAGNTLAAPGASDDQFVRVNAFNPGLFECTVDVPTFDFGTVDGSGLDLGTPDVVARGRNAADTGGVYENTAGSVEWTCRALPTSVVDIALVAVSADHTGGMTTDDLEVRIPDTGSGVSSGYQVFTSQATLVSGLSVGRGANAAHGQLDLRLTVLDTDPTGPNTWVVRLRATGNP